jgi:hypothetical protein
LTTAKPTEKDFLALIGPGAGLWTGLRQYLAENYGGHRPELSVGKKERDWTIRYRRSGKTLVTLMPEEGGFCALVVLGKDEVEKARKVELNAAVREVFDKAKQYHDGRWLWIRPKTKGDLASVKALLAVKRQPQS